MSLTRFSGSVRWMIYCAALLAFTASILVIIDKNGGSRSVSAQEGPGLGTVFTNTTPIAVSDVAGPASLYPSSIAVSGLSGNVSMTAGSVKVTLNNFSHTFPDDLGLVLVGPTGAALLLQDASGGAGPGISNVTYTLSDTGAAQLPTGVFGAGTFKPSGFFTGDAFPAPGPGTTYSHPGPAGGGTATFSSVFGGTAPNGTWNLFVVDFADDDSGTYAGGWSLEITTTGGPATPTPKDAMADFDADGKTDPAIVRLAGGGSSPATWWIKPSSGNPSIIGSQWGQASDTFIPADFDGDLKDDIAVWRPGSQGYFYIIRSTNGTVRTEAWGTTGDDATVVGDYNGDSIDDIAIYRGATTPNGASYWWWKLANGTETGFQWGDGTDYPAPGDYDGDNKIDYAVQRPNGAVSDFYIWRSGSGTFTQTTFGTSADLVVPGDYDNDLKTDIAVVGTQGATWLWSFRPSSGGPDVSSVWGIVLEDILAPGDYNGDGTADFAVWRFGPSSVFYAISPNNTGFTEVYWGTTTDEPVTKSYVH